MSLLLFWSRRSASTNTGHAEFPVTDAAGQGHVVVEEIDGSAEFPVTEGLGSGTAPPKPVYVPHVIGPPIPRKYRIFGSGHAELDGPAASGRGSQRLRPIVGAGRALLPAFVSSGSGRVLPRVSGTGAAEVVGSPEAIGSGLVVGPARVRSSVAKSSGIIDLEYDGYVAQPQSRQRRIVTKSNADDELDELFIMGIL